MSQAILPVSSNQNVVSPIEPQSSCLPNCVSEALQSIANFFSRLGVANLIGVAAIVLSAILFDALAGVVATLIFCTVKAFTPEVPSPQSAIAPQPAPPMPVPIRVERLPEGTIRSQFSQHTIWRHHYDVNNLNIEDPEIREAFLYPIPIRNYHNETCCAMAATLIDYFYQSRFHDLSPIRLDALLAKAIRVDQAIRQRNPSLGRNAIEIYDLTDNLEPGLLPLFQLDMNHIGAQRDLTVNTPQANVAHFRDLLTEFLEARPGGGPIAGSLLFNGHFNGLPSGHFTSLCIDRDNQGQILQIYICESSSSFSGRIRYDSGDNHWGAMVVPIGNTIEAAAAQLARFFSDQETATLFQTVIPASNSI